MNIDISAGIDHYSADELVGWANSGVLYCGEVGLSGLVEKLIEDRVMGEYKFRQEDLDEAHQEGYDDALGQARSALDNL